MGLRGYLIKRIINTAILILFVIVVNFIIFEAIPGETGAIQLLAENPRLDPAIKARIIHDEEVRFGILCPTSTDPMAHCPIWTKFTKYFVQMITFNFGISFQSGNSVVHDLASTGRLENTLTLLGVSSVIAIIIGVFLGVLTARRR